MAPPRAADATSALGPDAPRKALVVRAGRIVLCSNHWLRKMLSQILVSQHVFLKARMQALAIDVGNRHTRCPARERCD